MNFWWSLMLGVLMIHIWRRTHTAEGLRRCTMIITISQYNHFCHNYHRCPSPTCNCIMVNGMHPAGSPRSQLHNGRGLRMMDCYMFQKGLMHAHSDIVLQENGNGTGSTTSEASVGVPVLQSVHSEDVSRLRAPNQLINKLMAERVAETKPENMMPTSQFSSSAVPQKPETLHENWKTVVPYAESSDNAVASRPPATMGLPSASQMSNGLFVNIPPTQYEDSQQQQLPEYVGQPHILVRPDLFTTPYGNGVYSVRNVNGYPVEQLNRGSMLESSYGYGRSINGMMESLRVTPYENSGYHENWGPIVTTSNIGAVKELKPENPPLVQNCYPVRQQVGGDAAFGGNTFVNPGIVPEGNYVRPADQLLPSSSGLTQLQNFQSVIPSQALLLNPEITSEPMVSNGRLHGNPTFSCGFDPAHNNTINNIPIGDWKEEASQQLKDMTTELGGTPSVIVSIPPSSSGTNGHVELVQERFPSDPLLYNQDPMKILVSTSMLPPLSLKVASKESVILKDMPTENLLISTNAPDVAVVIEEGVFHQPPNSVIKESCLEHPVRATRVASGDEHIKQELQALAEGVASSVLQSSVTSAPTFVVREMKDPTTQQNKEWGGIDDSANSHNAAALGDPRIEEIKTKRIDKENSGFPIGDEIEIGRLQVINNTDLEELRELGSGTFGTVYHGKWRGSDVAIKRINDRCFAGKPSEQERMRADFWNEACNLADLHHPNVVAFYGVVLDGPGGSVATVTEYMANGSLRHALQKNDKILDQRKRLLIAMDVAFGMEYLHGKNIVHFDLKSDNLLVNLRDPQRPICKVGDLGLSKVKCHTLISGGVRGTLPWMAPELLNGSSSLVSEKVDVFSFGIVMWELLTGKEPYADLHYGMIIGGIVNNTLRPPVPESCSAEWRSLMEKCWLAEPSVRPSFTEIASRLRAMASSLPQKGSLIVGDVCWWCVQPL